MATGTVTATQGGSTTNGMALLVIVVTGQNASPIGVHPGATNTTPSLATGTGVTTGSFVYGSNLGLPGTYTVNGSTTYKQNYAGTGVQGISMRATATMTGGSSVTVGGTATVNSISIALQEILKGAGSLAEDASSPAGLSSNSVITLTTAAFTPPTGSLLVAMVQTNGGAGVTTVAMSDTFGLTWTPWASNQNGAGNGFAGGFTAPIAAPVTGTGMLLGGEI